MRHAGSHEEVEVEAEEEWKSKEEQRRVGGNKLFIWKGRKSYMNETSSIT